MCPLKKVRLKNKVTLERLAEAVDSDVGNLSRIERGIQTPNKALAERIVKYFNGEINVFQITWPEKFINNDHI
ncbi:MAG: helix-turn-helix transcriptional regulator [Chitinophagaceae bacterium]|nr:helix-turn-helix transcriptional regulator [Nitrosomonas sp.]MCW5929908.1 helix-turn-helix transcriptional regulator [Chitinophagaceae bacterium]